MPVCGNLKAVARVRWSVTSKDKSRRVVLAGHGPMLSFLLTYKVPSHVAEITFRNLPELIVAVSLLADHKFAMVAGVEPFRVCDNARRRAAAGAVEANPGAQLHKRTTLRQFRGFFVFDPNPGRPQTVLLDGNRADQNLIATGGSADLPPVSRGQRDQSNEQDWGQHHGNHDEKALLHGE